MHSLQIVEQKPAGEKLVEASNIAEQEVFVEVGEAFLDCFVESLNMSIHLGGLGISVIVNEVQSLQFFSKILLEFGTVVGQDEGDRIWEDLDAELEKLRRSLGSVGAGA